MKVFHLECGLFKGVFSCENVSSYRSSENVLYCLVLKFKTVIHDI